MRGTRLAIQEIENGFLVSDIRVDGGNNAQWTFKSPAEVGVFVREHLCETSTRYNKALSKPTEDAGGGTEADTEMEPF